MPSKDTSAEQTGSDAIDKIILDVAHAASMMQRGKTISAAMFPEAGQAIQAEITRARIHELESLEQHAEVVSTDRIDMVGMHKVLARIKALKAQTTQEES